MSNRWLVIREEDGLCVNAVVWDGKAKWAPPEGHFLLPYTDPCVGIGCTYDAKTKAWSVPPELEG